MLTISSAPEHVEKLYEASKVRCSVLVRGLDGLGETVRLRRDEELLGVLGTDRIASLLDGYLGLRAGDKIIRMFSEPDLVLPMASESLLTVTSEFASDVVIYQKTDVIDRIGKDADLRSAWLDVQAMNETIGMALCASYAPERAQTDFQLRCYEAGEPIIVEGEEPLEVYELLDGGADVSCEGRIVARIEKGEVFGEVGFLTDSTRSATVVARCTCLVRVVTRDAFIPTIESNPALIVSIARTLAQRLVSMNQRIGDAA